MLFLADQGNSIITAESEQEARIFQANSEVIATLGKKFGQFISQDGLRA